MINLFRTTLFTVRLPGNRKPWMLLCLGFCCYTSSWGSNARRWIFRIATLPLLLTGLPAQAASYTFPGNLPGDCTGSNGTYTCGTLTLGSGDTITIKSPTPATITVNGDLTTGAGNNINTASDAYNLTLEVKGTTFLGAGSTLHANVNGGGVVTIGNNSTVAGNIKTGSAAINVGNHSSVTGDITTAIAGVVNIGSNSTVNGNITTASGAINVGASSTVNGLITTTIAGAITLGANVTVTGSVATTYHGSEVGAGAITIGANSKVSGVVSTNTGAITINPNSKIGGDVSTNDGAITVENHAEVGGSVCTGNTGAITVGNNAEVGGNVETAHAGAITIGNATNVTGAVTVKGSGATTVAKNATVGTRIGSTCLLPPKDPEDPVTPPTPEPLKIISRQWRQLFMR